MSGHEWVQVWPGIPSTHPMLAGHFPGNPIVPGSVMLAEVLHCLTPGRSTAQTDQPPVDRWEFASVKFVRPLRPDTAVTIRFRQQASGQVDFFLMANEAPIAHGRVTATGTDSRRARP